MVLEICVDSNTVNRHTSSFLMTLESVPYEPAVDLHNEGASSVVTMALLIKAPPLPAGALSLRLGRQTLRKPLQKVTCNMRFAKGIKHKASSAH